MAAANNIHDSGPDGYTWTLRSPHANEYAEAHRVVDDTHGREWVFGNDDRIEVPTEEYADGNKFRSVVKLLMGFEGYDGERFMASGYLVSDNTLVTAGHCVYDHGGGRRVVWMECHIGYCGRPSEAFSNADGGEVQRRIATKVITPAQWLNEGQYFRDVAFVKVDPPFIGNLRPFTTGNLSDERRAPRVGVVGYPADKFVSDNSGRHDWGARMWQDFQAIEYDPQNSAYNRALEYRNVSTWGGQSGAPVIDEESGVVIGTHQGRTPDGQTNCASVFNPDHGVDFQKFHGALVADDISASIRDIPLSTPLPTLRDLGQLIECAKAVHDKGYGSQVLLDQYLGGALSAACGIALHFLDTGCPPLQIPGVSERAVLAEAAFQCAVRVKGDTKLVEIKGCIYRKYRDFGFTTGQADRLGSALTPILLRAATFVPSREAEMKRRNFTDGDNNRLIAFGVSTAANSIYLGGFGEVIRTTRVPVLIPDHTRPIASNAPITDRFFDSLGNYIQQGLRHQAQSSLRLRPDASNATPTADITTDAQAASLMTIRAVLAECALQVVLAKPQEWWTGTRILGDLDTSDTFLEGFMKRVQRIGPVVEDIVNADEVWSTPQNPENGYQDQ